MGIYGLTTYISEHSEDFLKDFKLHDCSVLIDGNAAAAIIYSRYTKSTHAFGGDYDKYANSVVEFVELLKKCNIFPCFIFDGGYETRKLKTILERIKLNIIICSQFKHKYRESKCFPLMLRDAFKEILNNIKVPVIQCDFEADQELAALARILKCPIISNDSDFYVCDVLYIPFTSLELKAVKLAKRNSEQKFYIRCKIHEVDQFLNKFGGLSDKTLLPFVSCILGNDYIPQNTFKNFLDISYTLKLPARIEKIVKWLRGIIVSDVAMNQLMRSVPKNHRGRLRRTVTKLFKDYNRSTSDLLPYIPEQFYLYSEMQSANQNVCIGSANEGNLLTIAEKFSAITLTEEESVYERENSIEIIDSCDYELPDNESESEEGSCKNLNYSVLQESNRYRFPSWLYDSYRSAAVSPTIMNIKSFNRIFIPSQSEDYFDDPSHLIALPILRIITGIVLGNASVSVKCHARLKAMSIGVYELSPALQLESGTELPNLNSVQNMDQNARQVLLLECLGLTNEEYLKRLPEEWKLFFITLAYWLKNCKSLQFNQYHIRAVILCLLYLGVIDRKIGYARTNSELRNREQQISGEEKCSSCGRTPEDILNGNGILQMSEVLEICTVSDCIVAANALLRYHQVDKNLFQNRKHFNLKLIHIFAQLQHCIHNINLLNCILNFPYMSSQICTTFCGTFLYNMCTELCSRKLSDGYITRTLLSKATSVISLYRYLIRSVELVLPSATGNVSDKAPKKKKRSSKAKKNNVKKVEEEEETEKNESVFLDSENIYSYLTVI